MKNLFIKTILLPFIFLSLCQIGMSQNILYPSVLGNGISSTQNFRVGNIENAIVQNADCYSADGITTNYPTTVNGIGISMTSTGDVTTFPNLYTFCDFTTGSGVAWIGQSSAFSITFTFSQKVNDVSILLSGSDPGEQFSFTTSDETPSLTFAGGCSNSWQTVGNSANCIIQGSGLFSSHTTLGYTSITVTGPGGQAGTLIGICKSSLGTACTLAATSTAGTILCNGGTTTVAVSATGGTGSLTGTGTFTVGAGPYSFKVTDAAGCSSTTTGTVTAPTAIAFGTPSVTNVTCNGGNNGQIVVAATGGTGTKTYAISPNVGAQSPSGTFTGLTAQTYTFTATDANGCTKTTTATVTAPTAIVFGTPSVTNLKCLSGNSGKVVVSATGGTGPITYAISPNIGSQSPSGTFNNLTAQTYTFTATDANGCTKTTTATVGTNPNTLPTVSLTSPANGAVLVTNATITATASDPDGTIAQVNFYLVYYATKTGQPSRTFLGSDNTAPYSFDWMNIPGGNYSIQVEAIDDCGASTFSSINAVNVLETFTVLITSPRTGQGFVPGSSVTIEAAVVAFTNRTIVKMEFIKDNIKLGEDLTAPYAYLWNNVQNGNYYLRAVATDNLGGVWYSPYTLILGINPAGRAVSNTRPSTVGFNLSPNPTKTQVTISTIIAEEGIYALNIMDALGRVVLSNQKDYQKGATTETLDVSNLTKGLYIVRLANANGKDYSVQKLIIE